MKFKQQLSIGFHWCPNWSFGSSVHRKWYLTLEVGRAVFHLGLVPVLLDESRIFFWANKCLHVSD